MSNYEETPTEPTNESLRHLESFWHVSLPETFRIFYTHLQSPILGNCEFYPIRMIVQGAGRVFGMLPQFLPFGRAIGDGGLYGFYVTPEIALGRLPVAYLEEDDMYLRPVASSFETFLAHCITVGRYEVEEEWAEDSDDWQETEERDTLIELFSLPETLLTLEAPRNYTELNERLLSFDPHNSASLCYLGCNQRSLGHVERALDLFHRASEVAPWFGDIPYLIADVFREREQPLRAIPYYWSVVQHALPLCTHTINWNLGEDHPEADVYEVAADVLSQWEKHIPSEIKKHPLWQVVAHEDPYDPSIREALGDAFYAQNDLGSAECEYLSALSLCYTERSRQPIRIYEALAQLYERRGYTRDLHLVNFDQQLPRTLL